MEENNLQTIDIRRILSLAPVVDEYSLGTDFIMGEVNGSQLASSNYIMKMLQYPVRFDGFVIFFVKQGNFDVDVNLTRFHVSERTLLVVVPGNIIKLSPDNAEHLGRVSLYFVLASKDFLSGIHLDIGKVFQDSIRMWNNPCITLTDETLSLSEDYFLLAKKILTSAKSNKQEIIRSLLTSFIYVTMDLWQEQISHGRSVENRSSARVNQVFERFISLVTEYHTTERGMAFYADKLCLTPKYLSKLVKQATGRSAPEWIDDYVILEAKNMLKYSDMAIKEIVYALHFPNQSVFYKFFKAHTGQTPTEYRRA